MRRRRHGAPGVLLALVALFALPRVVAAQQTRDVDARRVYLWSGGVSRSVVSVGSGAPSSGATGDVYVDYSTGEIYTRLAAGWERVPRLSTANTFSAVNRFNANVGIGVAPSAPLHVVTSSSGDVARLVGVNSAEWQFDVDANGRATSSLRGEQGAGSNGGAYYLASGYEEAFFSGYARSNTAGSRNMRFGNKSDKWVVQLISDDESTVTSTPLTVEATAPSNTLYVTSAGDVVFGTTSSGSQHVRVYDTTNLERGVLVENTSTGNAAAAVVRLTTGAQTAALIRFGTGHATHANELALIQPGNFPLALWTQDTARVTVLGSGDVGIGTTGPGNLVHVYNTTNLERGVTIENTSTGNAASAIVRLTTGAQTGALIRFGTGHATQANKLALIQPGNFPIEFWTTDTSRMAISGAGAVTIAQTLGVTGLTTLTGGAVMGSASTLGASTLKVGSTGEAQVTIASDTDSNDADTDVMLRFTKNGDTGTLVGFLAYDEGRDKLVLGYNGSTAVQTTFDSSGNVLMPVSLGVGISSIGSSVIKAGSTGEAQITIASDTDNNDADTDAYLRFTKNGDVGTLVGLMGYDEGLDRFVLGYNGNTAFRADSSGNVELPVKLTKYSNVSTAGWGLPAIYGSGRSAAQTAAVTSVATYTVGASDGSFLVWANVNVTTATNHSFSVVVDFTDETNTARSVKLRLQDTAGISTTDIVNGAGAIPYFGIPIVIRAKASTSITIKTTGTFTTVTYNVEGSIVQSS